MSLAEHLIWSIELNLTHDFLAFLVLYQSTDYNFFQSIYFDFWLEKGEGNERKGEEWNYE